MMIEFKPYSPEDKINLLEMMTLFNRISGYPFDPVTGEKNLVDFTSSQSLGQLYLITHEDVNIGYIILTFGFSFEYQGRDAFIDELFIRDDYRKRGIGKMTIDFIEERAKDLGVNAIHLEVETDNEDANKLYLDRGFKTSRRKLLTKRITSARGCR